MGSPPSSKQIPTIDVLCNELAISPERKNEFLQCLRQHRQDHKFNGRECGTDLVDWYCDRTQKRLGTMTWAYLFTKGKGAKWWPPARADDSQNAVAFPIDKDFIAPRLGCIFYRQNVNEVRGAKKYWGPHDKEHSVVAASRDSESDSLQTINISWQQPRDQSRDPVDSQSSSVVAAEPQARHQDQDTLETLQLSHELRPTKSFEKSSSGTVGIAPVAKMINDPNLAFDRQVAVKAFSPPTCGSSPSPLHSMQPSDKSSDDENDEDYVDRGPRKSERSQGPTRRTPRKKAKLTPKKTDYEGKGRFQPDVDCGRLPARRRKTRSDKGIPRTRSVKGVLKTQSPPGVSASSNSSSIENVQLPGSVVETGPSIFQDNTHSISDSHKRGIQVIEISSDDDMCSSNVDVKDPKICLAALPSNTQSAVAMSCQEKLPQRSVKLATLLPQSRPLQLNHETLCQERNEHQLQYQHETGESDGVLLPDEYATRIQSVLSQQQSPATARPFHNTADSTTKDASEVTGGPQLTLLSADESQRGPAIATDTVAIVTSPQQGQKTDSANVQMISRIEHREDDEIRPIGGLEVTQACDDCREKTLRCDGKMPTCGYCSNRTPDCIFTIKGWKQCAAPNVTDREIPPPEPVPDGLDAVEVAESSPTNINDLSGCETPPTSAHRPLAPQSPEESPAAVRFRQMTTPGLMDVDAEACITSIAEQNALMTSQAPQSNANVQNDSNTPPASSSDTTDPHRSEGKSTHTASDGHPAATPVTTLTQHDGRRRPQIRFIIIKSRTPRLNRKPWRTGSMDDKTFSELCSEIETLIQCPHIQRIDFKLTSEIIQCDGNVDRDLPEEFNTVRDEFREEIMTDMVENGTTMFEVSLEPGFGRRGELEPATPAKTRRSDIFPFGL